MLSACLAGGPSANPECGAARSPSDRLSRPSVQPSCAVETIRQAILGGKFQQRGLALLMPGNHLLAKSLHRQGQLLTSTPAYAGSSLHGLRISHWP